MGIAIEKLVRRTAVIAVAAGMLCAPAHRVFAARDGSQFELSDSVEIEDLPNEAAAHLVRVRALLANEKWDEAVETLRKMAADPYGDYLIDVSPRRYVSVREFCQIQLAGLPPAALELYRRRVDPVADTWYEQGVAARDAAQLRRVVDRFFCSRAGDNALLWLGDWALQQGRYDEARRYWEQISPDLRAQSRLSFWYDMFGTDLEKSYRQIASQFEQAGRRHPEDWLVYPDTAIDLVAVRARLVLVSIMQDAVERARWELGVFERLHPDNEGRLAGRNGRYRDILADLLEQQARWSDRATSDDWPTFAGAATRSRALPLPFDIPPLAKWTINYADVMPHVDTLAENPRLPARYGHSEKRLGFHPLVVGDLVLFNSSEQVFAVTADTGEPAFQGSQGGQIYPRGKLTESNLAEVLQRSPLTEPRYTMTAFKDRLFVRIGTQVTARPRASGNGFAGNRLVCLDLKKEGALKWEYPSGEDNKREFDKQRWAFEGPPLTDGDGVYIAMHAANLELSRMLPVLTSVPASCGGGERSAPPERQRVAR